MEETFPVSVGEPSRAIDHATPWNTEAPTPINTGYPGLNSLTQISQSLENIQGHYYQLFGSSSEADPWLLRHCKFDDYGFQKFFKVYFRNAGGVPTREKIPAHFVVYEKELYDDRAADAVEGQVQDPRAELASLVPLHHGQRLLRL